MGTSVEGEESVCGVQTIMVENIELRLSYGNEDMHEIREYNLSGAIMEKNFAACGTLSKLVVNMSLMLLAPSSVEKTLVHGSQHALLPASMFDTTHSLHHSF